jgi:hypothetical protein
VGVHHKAGSGHAVPGHLSNVAGPPLLFWPSSNPYKKYGPRANHWAKHTNVAMAARSASVAPLLVGAAAVAGAPERSLQWIGSSVLPPPPVTASGKLTRLVRRCLYWGTCWTLLSTRAYQLLAKGVLMRRAFLIVGVGPPLPLQACAERGSRSYVTPAPDSSFCSCRGTSLRRWPRTGLRSLPLQWSTATTGSAGDFRPFGSRSTGVNFCVHKGTVSIVAVTCDGGKRPHPLLNRTTSTSTSESGNHQTWQGSAALNLDWRCSVCERLLPASSRTIATSASSWLQRPPPRAHASHSAPRRADMGNSTGRSSGFPKGISVSPPDLAATTKLSTAAGSTEDMGNEQDHDEDLMSLRNRPP